MNKSITYKFLLTIIASFVFGIVTVLIIQNYLLYEKIEFNTLGLLGFVFSIIFAGASIVLAITAINLARSSESVLIERSEKSIELQNDVYIKTTEALNKIESSTGVTEKRIEDIIAGRVGDIASRLVDDRIVTSKNKESLEKELRRSLTKDETEEERIERKERRKREKELDLKYDKFKNDTLLFLTNLESSKALRIGEGSYHKHGVELLDGLFSINNEKIGICTFYSDPVYYNVWNSAADELLNNLAEELVKKTFNKVFLATNELSEITNKFNEVVEKIKSLYKPEIANNIIIISGTPEDIVKEIVSNVP